MRVTILGTTGQLAVELHRSSPSQFEVSAPLRVDVTDEARLLAHLDQSKPQIVINATGYTAVDRAESEAAQAFAVNHGAPKTMARWCCSHGAALVHVSTDYVFDGTKTGAYAEGDAPNPLGVYGKSKLAGEEEVRSAMDDHVIVRTSWVFSAHGQNFVKTIARLAREREELRVVADQLGKPTAASHLATAIWRIATRIAIPGGPVWGTYHFAGEPMSSWHGLAERVVEEQASSSGRSPRVVPITTADYPTPARRPAHSELDTGLFIRTFGQTPRSWRDELRVVVQQLAASTSPPEPELETAPSG